eukprot:TRINITY_DN15127_c0_g2_i2.p1 TRINITY_DN15127_c0_g2~~TRINITY_DN15127_c0_g2_i2.p1  ORF type:complete len:259 (+),score=45.72 TRINITY_DN15127_c0_g2_i2:90-866(+)
MQINRIANKITKSYLMDPYAMLMHYKRAFKLMKLMKDANAKVLILGNKNQFGINWKGRFEGMDFDTGIVDDKVISTAPKHYKMILCLDPVLYCRSLNRINVPVMMCATAREITEHPEILDVTDYLLPSPTSRHDAALRQLIAAELDSSPSSATTSKDESSTRQSRDASPTRQSRDASPTRGRDESLQSQSGDERRSLRKDASSQSSESRVSRAPSESQDSGTESSKAFSNLIEDKSEAPEREQADKGKVKADSKGEEA